MIIKNMEEFGAVRDAGKQMELLLDGSCWNGRDFNSHEVALIEGFIRGGRIRTKPKVTYFRMARDRETGKLLPYELDEPFGKHCWDDEGPQKFLFDHTLESEE